MSELFCMGNFCTWQELAAAAAAAAMQLLQARAG
jgi:hypothetical protein